MQILLLMINCKRAAVCLTPDFDSPVEADESHKASAIGPQEERGSEDVW